MLEGHRQLVGMALFFQDDGTLSIPNDGPITVTGRPLFEQYQVALPICQIRAQLMGTFLQDITAAIDERLVGGLDPENHIPLDAVIRRFNFCLLALGDKWERTPRPTPLPADLKEHVKRLKPLFNKAKAEVERGIETCFLNIYEAMVLHQVNGTLQNSFQAWGAFLRASREKIARLGQWLSRTDQLHRRILGDLEERLKRMDRGMLARNRQDLVLALQEMALKSGFHLLYAAMAVRDGEAVSKLDGVVSELDIENVLPDELIDFFDLEGIEEIIDRLTEGVVIAPTASPEPAAAAAAPSASPTAALVAEPAAATPSASPRAAAVAETVTAAPSASPRAAVATEPAAATPSASPRTAAVAEPAAAAPSARTGIATAAAAPARSAEEQVRFTIRRGEKVRKIVAKLKAWGFYPSSNSRGRGSHRGFENADGKRLTVPVGGHRVHMKPGTAASVAAAASE